VHELNMDVVYAGCALFCALAGAGYDVASRRIPNALTLPAILFGLLVHGSLGGWRQLGSAATGGLLCGVVFLVFYVAGGMGGGDVKLMAAVGCNAGLPRVAMLLLVTSLAGGAMAITLAAWRRRLKETMRNVWTLAAHHGTAGLEPHPDLNLDNQQALRLPYALAIAAGSAGTFCWVMAQR
jgi:prepilin peptidase CpaA